MTLGRGFTELPSLTPGLARKIIRHEHGKWVLYTRDGTRVLGRHPTRADAERQERAVEWAKHAG